MRPYTFSIWIYKTYVSKLKIIFRRCRIIIVIRRVDNYKVTCKNCKSVLGFKLSDVTFPNHHSGGHITCPVCHNEVKIIVTCVGGDGFMVGEVEPIYNEKLGEDNG